MVKKICNILSTIIIVLLACVAALLIVPKILGMQAMAVLTGSMEPNIHVGAIVFVKQTPWEELTVGDVVTYNLNGGTYVTHRVVAKDEAAQTVTTQGDANESADSLPVAYNNVLGRMAFQVPGLGYISIYAKTPLGIAGISAVMLVVILLIFLPDVLTNSKKESTAAEGTEEQKQISEKK